MWSFWPIWNSLGNRLRRRWKGSRTGQRGTDGDAIPTKASVNPCRAPGLEVDGESWRGIDTSSDAGPLSHDPGPGTLFHLRAILGDSCQVTLDVPFIPEGAFGQLSTESTQECAFPPLLLPACITNERGYCSGHTKLSLLIYPFDLFHTLSCYKQHFELTSSEFL